MKAKIGPVELEVKKEDYDALQKISNINIFKIISDEFALFRLFNLMRISKIFEEKCKKTGFNPQKIAPKFLARFIDAASYEEDEDLQEMWANLLISESNAPNSNSLRTIETLKNLSKDEAAKFRSVCKDAMFAGNRIVIFNNQGNSRTLDDILILADCGLLISENTMVESTTKIPKSGTALPYLSIDKTLVIKTTNETPNEASCGISILSMTEAGKDIFKANIAKEIDDSVFIDNAKIIKKNNSNLKITLHKIISFDEAKITYSKQDILADENGEKDG